MSSVNAQADVAHDWKGLLDSVEKSPDLLPLVGTEWTTLAQFLAEFQKIKARQVELTALRQETTQQLDEVVARGKEVAVAIRSVLRGKVGPWNERLVQYQIAPIRRRPRKPVDGVKKPADGVRTEPVVKVPPPADPVA
jgi:hypothetical protein